VADPVVSVIIPCYNQGRYLADAIDSVLGQTYSRTEVVVVDDGSTDCTSEVAMRYRDRLHYLHQRNAGPSAARNSGLLASQGELVLFLDADDYLWPDVLERHVEAARRTPSASVFVGAWQEVDQEGHALTPICQHTVPEDVFHTLVAESRYHVHCAVIRRVLFSQVGLWDVELAASTDWDLFMRFAAAGSEFCAVPGAVSVYRRHPGSICTRYELLWRTGRSLMRKSRSYHPGCRLCRRATARGTANLRVYCYGLLREDLRACWEAKGPAKASAKLLRESLRNPDVARLLLEEPYRLLAHMARIAKRKVRAAWAGNAR